MGPGASLQTGTGGRATYTRIDNTSGATVNLPGVNFNLQKNGLVFEGSGGNTLNFGGNLVFNGGTMPVAIQIKNNATLGFNKIWNNQNVAYGTPINGGTIAVGSGGIQLNTGATAGTGMWFSGSGNMTVAGPIIGGSSANTLEWGSTGTLTMSGANTYTGTTYLRAGKVVLDHGSGSDTAKLSSTAALNMAGSAILELRGGAANETVNGVYLDSTGVSAGGRDIAGETLSIIRTGGSTGVINLGTIARFPLPKDRPRQRERP